MILRRLTENLRAQNWTAISIEFLIVVLGVFLGTQVSNWNEERAEKREIGRLLDQMRPEIARLRGVTASTRHYYAITDRFADTALNGWNGDPKVSDRDFVIAAYQASQVNGIASDANNFSQLMGGDQIRKIDDPKLRTAVMRLLNYDFVPVSYLSIQTRYRDGVRSLIPMSIQEQVRSQCGDRTAASGVIQLPLRCDVDLPPAHASAAATQLRAKPDMIGDLQLHQAAVATFLFNLSRLESRLRDVERLNR
jgi:hypothetical protein